MRTIKLRDIASPISINISNPSDCRYDKFVGLEHYDSGEFVISRYSDVKLLTSAAKEFRENDILIARRNVYLKRAGIVKFDGITSGDSIILRVNEHTIDTVGVPREIIEDYLPLVLNTEDFWLYANKHADGMNSKRISKDTLLDYEFMLPSEIEIKTISEKAWAAYRLKEAYKRLLVATDEMVKSQFIEMFGDPITNTKNWKISSLKNACVLVSDGPFGSNLKSCHYVQKGVRVIRLQNICQGQFNDTDRAYISNEHYKTLKKYTCKPGEIVIATLGEPNLRACIIPDYIKLSINKADCIHVIPNSDLLNPVFVCSYFNSTQVLHLATSDIHGTTRARIAGGQVANFPVSLPPIKLQEEFAAIVCQADKSKFELKKAIEAIDQVIKSLING